MTAGFIVIMQISFELSAAKFPNRHSDVIRLNPQFIGLFFMAVWIPGGQSQRFVHPHNHWEAVKLLRCMLEIC